MSVRVWKIIQRAKISIIDKVLSASPEEAQQVTGGGRKISLTGLKIGLIELEQTPPGRAIAPCWCAAGGAAGKLLSSLAVGGPMAL